MNRRLLEAIGVGVVIVAVAGILKVSRGSVGERAKRGTKNRVGRARPAGHLDRRVPDTAAAAPQSMRNRGLLCRPGTGRLRYATLHYPPSGPARNERGSEARRRPRVQRGVPVGWKPTGRRTSLVVDPPVTGRIPPPLKQETETGTRKYRLALLQPTNTCKTRSPVAPVGGRAGLTEEITVASPVQAESATKQRMRRTSMSERCMAAVLPDFAATVGLSNPPAALVNLLPIPARDKAGSA